MKDINQDIQQRNTLLIKIQDSWLAWTSQESKEIRGQVNLPLFEELARTLKFPVDLKGRKQALLFLVVNIAKIVFGLLDHHSF